MNLCILGCGAVARVHGAVARSLRSELTVCFASRTRGKAERYARRFDGVAVFGSYEAACADPRVDAVAICTPPALHPELASLAAAHGKAILIEKPVTRTLDELGAIQAAVSRAAVPCMVAENYYFKPVVGLLRRRLAAGDIGVPWVFELWRVGQQRVTGWRADADAMGGGALLEGGVHWINFLCRLGGDALEVRAERLHGDRASTAPFEDGVVLDVRFVNGAVGRLVHDWNAPTRWAGPRLSSIAGDTGWIRFESNGLFVLVLGRRKRLYVPGLSDLMGRRAMLRHFAHCVREGQPPAMSLAVARHDLAIVHAAYRSLDSGRYEAVEGARRA